jgi:hypothetical protein
MKSWYKSKINWVGIALILVGFLEFITPGVLESLGITNPERWASILGFILVFLRQMTSQNTTPIFKIGGRPQREKKPTSILPDNMFVFSGNDFAETDSVYYSTTAEGDQFSATIDVIIELPNSQRIKFVEPIDFTNLEDLAFYIY